MGLESFPFCFLISQLHQSKKMIPAVFHVNQLWSTRAGSPACHATFAIEKRPTLQDAKFHSQIRKNLSGGGNSVHSLMSDMPAYPSWTTLEKRADVSCDSKRILQAMVRGGILRKSLESTKYECKLQGIPDQFLCILWDSHWYGEGMNIGLTQETRLKSISDLSIPERFVFVNSSMCLTWGCWASVTWTKKQPAFGYKPPQILWEMMTTLRHQTKMERIWENQICQNNAETKKSETTSGHRIL